MVARRAAASVRVGAVVIDCNDFSRMSGFWKAALGYLPREEPEAGWVVLRDPAGTGVNVSIAQVPEPRIGKNRLHMDLYTHDAPAEVERLRALGAEVTRRPAPDEDFTVLADPEGNLFCVVQKGPLPAQGSASA